MSVRVYPVKLEFAIVRIQDAEYLGVLIDEKVAWVTMYVGYGFKIHTYSNLGIILQDEFIFILTQAQQNM